MGDAELDIHTHEHVCGHIASGVLIRDKDVSPWRPTSGPAGSSSQLWCRMKGKGRVARPGSRGPSARFGYSCHRSARGRLLEKSHPQRSCSQSPSSREDIPCFLPNKVQMVKGHWSVICQSQSAMKNLKKKKKRMPVWYTYISLHIFSFFNKATNIELSNRRLRL